MMIDAPMTDPRYRVWRQTFGAEGLAEPSAGPWLSKMQAYRMRDGAFKQPDVARTWIEKEGVSAEFVGETPFIEGPPQPAEDAPPAE